MISLISSLLAPAPPFLVYLLSLNTINHSELRVYVAMRRLSLLSILLGLALVAPLAKATATACVGPVVFSEMSFGDAYDLYASSPMPDVDSLMFRSLRLTGVFNGKTPLTGVESGYLAFGLTVDDHVPQLSFSPKDGSLSQTQAHYVTPSPWGNVTFKHPATPLKFPSLWPNSPSLKQNSISFWVHLLGDEGLLFPFESSAQPKGEFAQFYCRAVGESLLCMVEKFGRVDGELTPESIAAFMVLD